MPASIQPQLVNVRSVLLLTLLTLLCLLFLPAVVTTGFFGIPPEYLPRALRPTESHDIGLFKLASLAICPALYFWIVSSLVEKQARRLDAIRYALVLQLQAFVELVACGIQMIVIGAVLYLLASAQAGEWSFLPHFVASDDAKLILYMAALALLPLSMLMTVWRLHALSRVPGTLAAAVNGKLCRKSVRINGDSSDVRNELIRHLERLTGPGTPGLGRVIYGSHPRLTSREIGGEVVHTLAWLACPTKLLVSCHPLDDGRQEVRVRCALRSGLFRIYCVQTPVDAAAQMQYIDAHLFQPLTAQLAKVAAERQRDTLRDQAVTTQLRILQAQIEPHFLFNTLATVRQLYRTSVADGESMMDHLIIYLRSAMDDLRAEHSSIVKEMNLLKHFLAIMKIRMGERLSYHFSIVESLLAHPFPPAMLISLVENAIKHGLTDCEHGAISMSASRDGDMLRVTIADNGAGFSSVGGTGMGLSNIRQRLETMYGTQAWLEVGAPATGGFTATIVIPYQERNH
jgi:signal transduction histidine kinase